MKKHEIMFIICSLKRCKTHSYSDAFLKTDAVCFKLVLSGKDDKLCFTIVVIIKSLQLMAWTKQKELATDGQRP